MRFKAGYETGCPNDGHAVRRSPFRTSKEVFGYTYATLTRLDLRVLYGIRFDSAPA